MNRGENLDDLETEPEHEPAAAAGYTEDAMRRLGELNLDARAGDLTAQYQLEQLRRTGGVAIGANEVARMMRPRGRAR